MNRFHDQVVSRRDGRQKLRRLLVVMAGLASLAAGGQSASAALLSVDVNDRTVVDTPNTVAGFAQFQLSGTTAAVPSTTQALTGGYSLTVTAVDAAGAPLGGVDDRDRTGPATAPTLNQIYDDFIFTATGVWVGGGLDVSIMSGGNLMPNTLYRVSIYAFDPDSTPLPQPRTAAWTDGNNANAPLFVTSFDAAVPPVTDDQYKFTGVALTDVSGNLLLRGRNTTPPGATGGITPGVFINGLEVDVVPEPASALAAAFAATLLAARGSRRTRA